jgi:Family of unknown function (DUF5683)
LATFVANSKAIAVNMLRKLFFLFLCFLCLHTLQAQKQTDKAYTPDTTKMSRPKKATLLALVPGLGQIYNKKYWKLPIVYGGFAALIYSVGFYQNQYDIFRQAVQRRNAKLPIGDPQLEPLPDPYLVELRDFYRENRDLSWIGLGGLYALQIIDAAVDAHLQEFDVSENLSLRWDPNYQILYGQAFVGATIRLQF